MYSTGIINGFLLYCTALYTTHYTLNVCAPHTFHGYIHAYACAHTHTYSVWARKTDEKHCGEFQCVFALTHTLPLAHSVRAHTQTHTHCSFAEKH